MFKTRDVASALNTKGFAEDKKRDHNYYFLHHAGKKTSIYTKISHNETDIDDRLCSQMARQIRLKGPQFKEFVHCTLTGDAYLQILIADKQIILH